MFLVCEKCFDPRKHSEAGELDYGVCEGCSRSGDCLTVTTRNTDCDDCAKQRPHSGMNSHR